MAILALAATVATVRTFEIITEQGWVEIAPHRISNGQIFRVLDDGVPVLLAPELARDPGSYRAVQAQAEGLHFAVREPGGGIRDGVVSYNPS